MDAIKNYFVLVEKYNNNDITTDEFINELKCMPELVIDNESTAKKVIDSLMDYRDILCNLKIKIEHKKINYATRTHYKNVHRKDEIKKLIDYEYDSMYYGCMVFNEMMKLKSFDISYNNYYLIKYINPCRITFYTLLDILKLISKKKLLLDNIIEFVRQLVDTHDSFHCDPEYTYALINLFDSCDIGNVHTDSLIIGLLKIISKTNGMELYDNTSCLLQIICRLAKNIKRPRRLIYDVLFVEKNYKMKYLKHIVFGHLRKKTSIYADPKTNIYELKYFVPSKNAVRDFGIESFEKFPHLQSCIAHFK
jgi:hypothetical protein